MNINGRPITSRSAGVGLRLGQFWRKWCVKVTVQIFSDPWSHFPRNISKTSKCSSFVRERFYDPKLNSQNVWWNHTCWWITRAYGFLCTFNFVNTLSILHVQPPRKVAPENSNSPHDLLPKLNYQQLHPAKAWPGKISWSYWYATIVWWLKVNL